MRKAAFLALVIGAAVAGPALGAPIYMKFEGIDGEATAAPIPGAFEIQISQLDQLEHLAAQKAPRGGQNIVLQISSLNFTKRQDKASPQLMQANAKGQHIPRALITVRKAGGETALTVKLENCMISGFQTSAAHAGERPTESISINFTKILVDYKPQGSPAVRN